jgi:hypothetical protein
MNKLSFELLSGFLIILLWIPVTLLLTLNFAFWTFVQFPEKMNEVCYKIWNEQ